MPTSLTILPAWILFMRKETQMMKSIWWRWPPLNQELTLNLNQGLLQSLILKQTLLANPTNSCPNLRSDQPPQKYLAILTAVLITVQLLPTLSIDLINLRWASTKNMQVLILDTIIHYPQTTLAISPFQDPSLAMKFKLNNY